MGSMVKIATELPLLLIGKRTFRKIRPCKDERAAYLTKGETVCVQVFRHIWRELIVVGGQSQNGPSWSRSFERMLATVFTYAAIWALIGDIPGLFIGWIIGMPFGESSVATGILLGPIVGIGMAWRSAVRLFLAWREMQNNKKPSLTNQLLRHRLALIRDRITQRPCIC
jgi:hypothetical protein